MNDLLSALFWLALAAACSASVVCAIRAAARPVGTLTQLLRRAYYVLVLCMITFGAYELYDLYSNKIGGALTGLAALVVMIGVLLAYIGMIAEGIVSFWSRRMVRRRAPWLSKRHRQPIFKWLLSPGVVPDCSHNASWHPHLIAIFPG
ncbi:hypothetical protein [Caballeronia sp. LZ035]|uniref:hypothetical protein n=1 Tax=Caballeronia sp. LZ035 TaxID=3038568 RepID=UPI002860223D|nr:hypothetical protein [Caballeronia sp. LZ035]MDR5759079.1 hypothetical protein [Caballeronia sp. LZ035]